MPFGPTGYAPPMATDVRHEPEQDRYAVYVDGEEAGECHYRVDGDRVVFDHTHVDPRHRGKGLADTLVREALDDTRRAGRDIVAQCWFVVEVLEREAAPPAARRAG